MLEVPAPSSGVLQEIKVKEGEVVTADQLLAVLIEGEVAAADTAEVDSATTGVSDVEQSKTDNANAGPAARRAAKESGVDISAVKGSGRHGRVTKSDLTKAQVTDVNTTSSDGERSWVLAPKNASQCRVCVLK